jgi:hypothetical protein
MKPTEIQDELINEAQREAGAKPTETTGVGDVISGIGDSLTTLGDIASDVVDVLSPVGEAIGSVASTVAETAVELVAGILDL